MYKFAKKRVGFCGERVSCSWVATRELLPSVTPSRSSTPRCAVLIITIKESVHLLASGVDCQLLCLLLHTCLRTTKIDRRWHSLSHSMGETGYEQKKKVVVRSSTSLLDIISWKSRCPLFSLTNTSILQRFKPSSIH